MTTLFAKPRPLDPSDPYKIHDIARPCDSEPPDAETVATLERINKRLTEELERPPIVPPIDRVAAIKGHLCALTYADMMQIGRELSKQFPVDNSPAAIAEMLHLFATNGVQP